MTSLKTYLAATAALLAFGAAGTAHATPYAYGNVNFSNLILTGLNAPGVTINSSTVTTSSSASYDGFAPDAASAGGDIFTGSNVRQSFSGPAGNAPPQDTYSMQLQSSSGARGDAIITGNLSTGASAQDVAGGRLTVPSSTAGSAGGTSTGINVSVTLASPTTFALSFTGSESLVATTDVAGDGASAQVNASFSVTGTGFAGFIFSPDALNGAVSASGPNGNQSLSTGPTNFSTSVTVGPGTYQISLLSGAQERLQTGPQTSVPEPMSLALLGSGLIGLGLLRNRRRS